MKETIYDIVDTECRLVAQHVRRDFSDDTKEYWWKRDGQYNLGEMKVEDVPLFGMKGLAEAAPGADVIITEGEKAAASLIARGFLALGTVTGASGCPSQSVFEPLIGSQRVYLWPDNDDVGLAHMQKVARHLQALGIPTYRVTWPEALLKGDAADFTGDLGALLAAAQPWDTSPPIGNVSICVYNEEDNPDSRSNGTKAGHPLTKPSTESCPVLESLSQQVLAWVKDTSGWWSTQELDADLAIQGPGDKENRKKILQRLREQGIIESHPKVNKQWRYVNKRVTSLDFKGGWHCWRPAHTMASWHREVCQPVPRKRRGSSWQPKRWQDCTAVELYPHEHGAIPRVLLLLRDGAGGVAQSSGAVPQNGH